MLLNRCIEQKLFLVLSAFVKITLNELFIFSVK